MSSMQVSCIIVTAQTSIRTLCSDSPIACNAAAAVHVLVLDDSWLLRAVLVFCIAMQTPLAQGRLVVHGPPCRQRSVRC
jgi:hypothetical protein